MQLEATLNGVFRTADETSSSLQHNLRLVVAGRVVYDTACHTASVSLFSTKRETFTFLKVLTIMEYRNDATQLTHNEWIPANTAGLIPLSSWSH